MTVGIFMLSLRHLTGASINSAVYPFGAPANSYDAGRDMSALIS